MPASDSPVMLVARFLRSNNYTRTLDAFISEAGLPRNAGSSSKGDLTIERILEEKKTFDQSVRFEKHGSGDSQKWSLPSPSVPEVIESLPSKTNILSVGVESWHTDSGQGTNVPGQQVLIATTADRLLNLLEPQNEWPLLRSSSPHDSPILSIVMLPGGRFTVSSSMSGQVLLYDHELDKVIDERRDHSKYVVKVALWEAAEDKIWIATAGWDAKVLLYRLPGRFSRPTGLGQPLASITLPTNPETLLFVISPDERLYLLLTRRDSTSIYYWAIRETEETSGTVLECVGSQNLAPHSNAWVAFSPSAIAICPKDPTLLAVATSSVPHLKLLLVRLLFPTDLPVIESRTQAAQRTAVLAIENREDAAIVFHISTMAPQTPYSTPQVCWRPDGSGIWVNGDDGVIRGVEASTGKVIAKLAKGHEPGSKIRSIWAGTVGKEELVISGGFDKRLVVWKVEDSNDHPVDT